MTMDKVRNLAVKILTEVKEQGAYANVALARTLRQHAGASPRWTGAFLTELVYGTVKAGGTLDWILRRYVNRPLRKDRAGRAQYPAARPLPDLLYGQGARVRGLQ
jgi:16S rRNA (cytosine967-C5)-methyltransferase